MSQTLLIVPRSLSISCRIMSLLSSGSSRKDHVAVSTVVISRSLFSFLRAHLLGRDFSVPTAAEHFLGDDHQVHHYITMV